MNSFKNILIVCDMEGSSGCRSVRAAKFLNREWADACAELTLDVNAVVTALFAAGIRTVTIKDFHRTGHNLFTRQIDSRARIISGYLNGAVPGMGNLEGIDSVLFIGMHASSGSRGFIPHTLTSRIARLSVKNKSICEAQLFSAALASQGIQPLFFSGCPVACREAAAALPGITAFPIDKFSRGFDAALWRTRLARAAVRSLAHTKTAPFNPRGPMTVKITFRDGEKAAAKFASAWKLERNGDTVRFTASDMRDIYLQLTAKLYCPRPLRAFLPAILPVYNIIGKLGILWADRIRR
jgi:D-aminopeptidase